MICQRCGILEATVHLSDPGHSPRRFQWLCSKCADSVVSSMVSKNEKEESDSENTRPKAWDPTAINAEMSNSKKGELLGKMFGLITDDQASDEAPCRQCGMHLREFRQTGLLGCPQCYVEFREALRPFLAKIHGHTSHLGHIPDQANGVTSPEVKVMRLRVDLEKAIAAEEFEKAARLRDEIMEIRKEECETTVDEPGESP